MSDKDAYTHLLNNQQQADMDGTMVTVSRQALDEVLIEFAEFNVENVELRHDIARHVAIAAEQATELSTLRAELDRMKDILRRFECLRCEEQGFIEVKKQVAVDGQFAPVFNLEHAICAICDERYEALDTKEVGDAAKGP